MNPLFQRLHQVFTQLSVNVVAGLGRKLVNYADVLFLSAVSDQQLLLVRLVSTIVLCLESMHAAGKFFTNHLVAFSVEAQQRVGVLRMVVTLLNSEPNLFAKVSECLGWFQFGGA
jgi:hypothetical protein